MVKICIAQPAEGAENAMFRFKFTQPGKSHLAELCADSEDAALVAPAEEEGNNGEWIGTGIEIARHLNSTFVAFLMMFHARSTVSACIRAAGRSVRGE